MARVLVFCHLIACARDRMFLALFLPPSLFLADSNFQFNTTSCDTRFSPVGYYSAVAFHRSSRADAGYFRPSSHSLACQSLDSSRQTQIKQRKDGDDASYLRDMDCNTFGGLCISPLGSRITIFDRSFEGRKGSRHES